MLKFQIITWASRKAHEELLESYFRLRHRIYVVDRQWRELDRPIPLEIDEFDDAHAIYLLGIDEDGKLGGGSRLIPTTRPHLLSDIFPMLASDAPPRRADIFEWSRFFISPGLRQTGDASPAAGMVLCGLLEACLLMDVRQLTVVCEAFWPERLGRLGWRARPLGPVLDHPDGAIVALLIEIDHETLARTRAAYGFSSSALLSSAASTSSGFGT